MASGDDSFEWFGGTVNAKYLIGVGGTDDDFDTDNGFSGRVQYGLSIRNPALGDFATGGFSNGFESDNDATGTALTPRRPRPCSRTATMILPPTATAAVRPFVNAAGALIRRNSAESVFNSVFVGRTFGLDLNSNSTNLTTANAAAGTLQFQNNVFAGYNPSPNRAARVSTNSGTTAGFNVNSFVGSSNDTITTVAGLGLNADVYNWQGNCSNRQCVPNLALPTASILNAGAAFTSAKLTGAGNGGPNSTFDVVNYRGAFGSNAAWAMGWTNYNPQITCYNVAGQTLATHDAASSAILALAVYPNPVVGAATLSFELKHSSTATVRVFDATGRFVAIATEGRKLGAGSQTVALPATLKAGFYTATIATEDAVESVRFVVAE